MQPPECNHDWVTLKHLQFTSAGWRDSNCTKHEVHGICVTWEPEHSTQDIHLGSRFVVTMTDWAARLLAGSHGKKRWASSLTETFWRDDSRIRGFPRKIIFVERCHMQHNKDNNTTKRFLLIELSLRSSSEHFFDQPLFLLMVLVVIVVAMAKWWRCWSTRSERVLVQSAKPTFLTFVIVSRRIMRTGWEWNYMMKSSFEQGISPVKNHAWKSELTDWKT